MRAPLISLIFNVHSVQAKAATEWVCIAGPHAEYLMTVPTEYIFGNLRYPAPYVCSTAHCEG